METFLYWLAMAFILARVVERAAAWEIAHPTPDELARPLPRPDGWHFLRAVAGLLAVVASLLLVLFGPLILLALLVKAAAS